MTAYEILSSLDNIQSQMKIGFVEEFLGGARTKQF